MRSKGDIVGKAGSAGLEFNRSTLTRCWPSRIAACFAHGSPCCAPPQPFDDISNYQDSFLFFFSCCCLLPHPPPSFISVSYAPLAARRVAQVSPRAKTHPTDPPAQSFQIPDKPAESPLCILPAAAQPELPSRILLSIARTRPMNFQLWTTFVVYAARSCESRRDRMNLTFCFSIFGLQTCTQN